ncbi:MAG: nucleoid occlusion protein [Firmicutes bacterium]|nr:nucleoid occlusion protein [Bacillota bacterium]
MKDNINRLVTGLTGGEDEIKEVKSSLIKPNPFQPRQEFKQEQLEELAQSIKTYGLLQPIIVRPARDGYQLVAGERRWRACTMLGWDRIPAVIKELNDSAMAAIALIENLQRENLDYFEEAVGYHRLLAEFGLTQEVLAQRIGKSQSTIANKMRLLKLAPEIRSALVDAQLSERHARALLKLPDDESREKVLNKIIKMGLNVRQTENLIEALNQDDTLDDDKAGTDKFIVKDYRILLNTIRQAVATIEQTGLSPIMEQNEHPDYFEVTIRLPKRA